MRRRILKVFKPTLFENVYFKIPQWERKGFPKGTRGFRNISEIEVGRNEPELKA